MIIPITLFAFALAPLVSHDEAPLARLLRQTRSSHGPYTAVSDQTTSAMEVLKDTLATEKAVVNPYAHHLREPEFFVVVDLRRRIRRLSPEMTRAEIDQTLGLDSLKQVVVYGSGGGITGVYHVGDDHTLLIDSDWGPSSPRSVTLQRNGHVLVEWLARVSETASSDIEVPSRPEPKRP